MTGRRLATAVGAGLTAALALAACGSGGGDGTARAGTDKGAPRLSVGGAYLPRPPLTDMAAGFLTVRNDGPAADRLTSVTTPLSPEVTMHTTEGTRMRQVRSLSVPAHGELRLASGGDHLMLGRLDHRPKVGEKVRLTLHFATSRPIAIEVPVEPTTYRPKD